MPGFGFDLSFCDILCRMSVLAERRLTMAATVDTVCPPGWRLDAAWSERLQDYDLWCVWRGRGEMTIDGRPIPLTPGTVLWMRPGHTYLASHDPQQPLGVRAVHFDLEPRPDEDELPPIVLSTHSPRLIEATLLRIHRLRLPEPARTAVGARPHDNADAAAPARGHEPHPDAGRALATRWLYTLLHDLIADTREAHYTEAGTAGLHRQRLEPIMAALREDPTRFDGVSDMARAAGYSHGHFARAFKRLFGKSPRDAWIDARIETATRMLQESSLSVSEIADALGYAGVYFFSRQFKQRTGYPPSDLRRRDQPPAASASRSG